MPISILLTVLIFLVWNLDQYDDAGSIAVAIPAIVDDSIVDIEHLSSPEGEPSN
ncbi:MAG: hypothetical protein U0936_28080 [Planctomycetaceae bacterium]